MAERIMMERRGDMLIPVDSEGQAELRKVKTGQRVGVDIVTVRNEGLHRKAFVLLKLAFDYWEPKNFVSTVEKKTVGNLGKFMVQHGVDADAARALCKQYMQTLNESRKGMDADRSFDAFREFITVEAGFYDTVITPAGPKRVAKSWAYKNMSDSKFQELYKGVFNACWDLVLKQTFDSPEHAESVVMELLSFDG